MGAWVDVAKCEFTYFQRFALVRAEDLRKGKTGPFMRAVNEVRCALEGANKVVCFKFISGDATTREKELALLRIPRMLRAVAAKHNDARVSSPAEAVNAVPNAPSARPKSKAPTFTVVNTPLATPPLSPAARPTFDFKLNPRVSPDADCVHLSPPGRARKNVYRRNDPPGQRSSAPILTAQTQASMIPSAVQEPIQQERVSRNFADRKQSVQDRRQSIQSVQSGALSNGFATIASLNATMGTNVRRTSNYDSNYDPLRSSDDDDDQDDDDVTDLPPVESKFGAPNLFSNASLESAASIRSDSLDVKIVGDEIVPNGISVSGHAAFGNHVHNTQPVSKAEPQGCQRPSLAKYLQKGAAAWGHAATQAIRKGKMLKKNLDENLQNFAF